MKLIYTIFLALLISCNTSTPESNMVLLPGYWEIDHVVFPDGTKKQYTVNSNIDFISFNSDSTGIRKKLAPKLDGSFIQTKSAQEFTIIKKSDSLILQYRTPYATWREWIVSASENSLTTQNKQGQVYVYKKFIPDNLELNE